MIRRRHIAAALCVVAVFLLVAGTLRAADVRARRDAAALAARADSRAPAPADVLRAARALKLVTVEIDATVEVVTGHASWRGDVAARVRAPVRLLYAVDLSRLAPGDITRSPLTGEYVLRLPAPERIASEVFTGSEDAEVRVAGLRLRSRAGEYYLGLARRALHDAAAAMTLSPSDAAIVRERSRQQVADLVRRIAGPDARVTVRLIDPPGAVAAARSAP